MENLNKRPSKGILKIPKNIRSNSLDKDIKWDETNIQETLHPENKDYGHMKIDEPLTPFNPPINDDDIASEDESASTSHKQIDLLEKVSRRLKEPPVAIEDENVEKLLNKSDELRAIANETNLCEDSMMVDEPANSSADTSTAKSSSSFEQRRKRHYNEFLAVKMAKTLWKEEEKQDDDDDDN